MSKMQQRSFRLFKRLNQVSISQPLCHPLKMAIGVFYISHNELVNKVKGSLHTVVNVDVVI